jgi:hypothetical protein
MDNMDGELQIVSDWSKEQRRGEDNEQAGQLNEARGMGYLRALQ